MPMMKGTMGAAGMKPGNLAPPKRPRPYQPGPGGTKLSPMLGGPRGMKRGGMVKGKKK